eukprot:1549432-Pleurochrysis_carterae.AAC.1
MVLLAGRRARRLVGRRLQAGWGVLMELLLLAIAERCIMVSLTNTLLVSHWTGVDLCRRPGLLAPHSPRVLAVETVALEHRKCLQPQRVY